MWYVYFLEVSTGDFGSTNDLERRIHSLRDGQVVSLQACRPIALKSYVAVRTKQTTGNFECYLKSGSVGAFAGKRF